MCVAALSVIVAPIAREDLVAREERAKDDVDELVASAHRAPIDARSGPQCARRRASGLKKSWKFCAESRIKDLK